MLKTATETAQSVPHGAFRLGLLGGRRKSFRTSPPQGSSLKVKEVVTFLGPRQHYGRNLNFQDGIFSLFLR